MKKAGYTFKSNSIIIMSLVLISINSCKKDDNKTSVQNPILTTTSISSITHSTAISGGNITSDGGSTIIAKGVCWSTNQDPTVTDSKTNDGVDTGSFISNITGLKLNTTYYVRAYATNSTGTGYGNSLSFKTAATSANTVTDIDGNVYHTVQIGNQTWMIENLKTTKYNDGTSIPYVTNKDLWSNLTTPAYCYYDNDLNTYKSYYGALYNWYAVNTGKLCPAGWHVPSDAEWSVLTKYFENQDSVGSDLRTIIHDIGFDNNTDYTYLSGGYRTLDGSYSDVGQLGYWWTATEYYDDIAYYRYLYNVDSFVYGSNSYKFMGLSVRCIKD
jgi:uncharacterized protein (TIGR02145 family)